MSATALKDSKGNELVIGTMYCCVIKKDAYENCCDLVRYAGLENCWTPEGEFQNPLFLDADTLEPIEGGPDFDYLVRQLGDPIDLSEVLA